MGRAWVMVMRKGKYPGLDFTATEAPQKLHALKTVRA